MAAASIYNVTTSKPYTLHVLWNRNELASLAINRYFCHICQIRHLRQKSLLSKGSLCLVIWFYVYNLVIWAINRHFRQIRHLHQNRKFQKSPYANSFEFWVTVWWFWRLIVIFAKYTISAKIAPLKGPLCHIIWIFVYSLAFLAIDRHFCHFCQCVHFCRFLSGNVQKVSQALSWKDRG